VTHTPPPILIFFHVGKTGGTTFGEILYRNFLDSERFQANIGETRSALGIRSLDSIREKVESLSEASRHSIRFVSGHVPIGVHKLFPQRGQYITILREPVDRVVSSFHYVRKIPTLPIHNAIKDMTLEQYMESGLGLDPFDYQVRVVSGCRSLEGFWEGERKLVANAVDACHLEKAKKNIEEHFVAAATLEQFTEILILVKRMYGWSFNALLHRRQNVTSNRPRLEDLSPSTRARIAAANQYDRLLYDWTYERFQRQVQELGREFRAECAVFNRINGQFEQRGMTSSLKRVIRCADAIFSRPRNRRQIG